MTLRGEGEWGRTPAPPHPCLPTQSEHSSFLLSFVAFEYVLFLSFSFCLSFLRGFLISSFMCFFLACLFFFLSFAIALLQRCFLCFNVLSFFLQFYCFIYFIVFLYFFVFLYFCRSPFTSFFLSLSLPLPASLFCFSLSFSLSFFISFLLSFILCLLLNANLIFG